MGKDLSRMDSSCDKTKAKQSLVCHDGKVFQMGMNDGRDLKCAQAFSLSVED